MKTLLSYFRHLMMTLAILGFGLPACAATFAAKNGITWTFDRDYPVGQYVNGDPWVVGPVTITAITPVPIEGRNGTMVNPQPGNTQGFDADFNQAYNPYVSALNVGKNLPLTVAVNSSVVSSITADASTQWDTIQMYAILTVVQNAPATNSFRPPAVGTGSRASLWNESQLDYTKLRTLPRAPLTAAPAIADYVSWFSYPWFEIDSLWTGGYLRPSYMAKNGYGREIAFRTGYAALLLNLDYSNAEKRALLIGVVQVGIDNYGFITQGGSWYNTGGHNIGRLSPLIIAAGVLNDVRLKNVITGAGNHFSEIQSTFFVSQADVNRVHGVWSNTLQRLAGTNGDPVFQYTAANIGMPEWGIGHTGNPELDNNWWNAQYRDVCACTFVGPTMTARVMGLRSTVNWEPLFSYAERHLNYEQSAEYGGEFENLTPLFYRQYFNTYKDAVPGSGGGVEPPPPQVTFAVGDRIQVTANTNIRNAALLAGTLLGVQAVNATGTIVAGPTGPDVNNITWWQVNYDSGADGWCGQDNFARVSGQPPSSPTGVHVKP